MVGQVHVARMMKMRREMKSKKQKSCYDKGTGSAASGKRAVREKQARRCPHTKNVLVFFPFPALVNQQKWLLLVLLFLPSIK